jgi:CMP-N,N'-diacetyllegionaminic acid synthase
MKVIGVIPARGGSQRLPGKNLLRILGKPLIVYTIEAALEAATLDAVFVSTDDEAIAAVAMAAGAEVMPRPPELATAAAALDDALRHVLAHVSSKTGQQVDVVVSMQANNPVRRKGEVDEVVARLRETPWATAVATAYKLSQRPEWAKRVVDSATLEIRPYMDAGTRYRMQDLEDLYLLDGATIAVRAAILQASAGDRRVHAYLGDRARILIHHPKYAVEIDNALDVERAEFYLSRR